MTATLQPRVTVAQAAKIMNVPERTVYQARELMRTGRTDLFSAVERGNMKLSAALKLAKPDKYGKRRDRYRELLNVWRIATDEERAAFLAAVMEAR